MTWQFDKLLVHHSTIPADPGPGVEEEEITSLVFDGINLWVGRTNTVQILQYWVADDTRYTDVNSNLTKEVHTMPILHEFTLTDPAVWWPARYGGLSPAQAYVPIKKIYIYDQCAWIHAGLWVYRYFFGTGMYTYDSEKDGASTVTGTGTPILIDIILTMATTDPVNAWDDPAIVTTYELQDEFVVANDMIVMMMKFRTNLDGLGRPAPYGGVYWRKINAPQMIPARCGWVWELVQGVDQELPRRIVDGLDGSVYITCRNSHGMVQLAITNIADATQTSEVSSVATAYTVNRHPYALSVDQSRNVYIASDKQELKTAGMLSRFNGSTVTHLSGVGGSGNDICVSHNDSMAATNMWAIGSGAPVDLINDTSKLARLKIVGSDIRYIGGIDGYGIEFTDYGSTYTPKVDSRGLVTLPITIDDGAGGTDVIKSHVFWIVKSGVAWYVVGTRDSAMERVNSTSVYGTGMVSSDYTAAIGLVGGYLGED
jgi:hypothetical protein